MTPRIGLAISGGGFRATCFGLGCLRALHDKNLLRHVTVMSGISGGSLLTAMYAYGPARFADFDEQTTEQLQRGLQLEIAKRTLAPTRVLRATIDTARVAALHSSARPQLRNHTRTDSLRKTLQSRLFGDRTMESVTHPGLATVITATDLRTTNAVRFGSAASACSAYGTITQPIAVAEAVACSAAFPFLLPTVDRRYEFHDKRTGQNQLHDLLLTDGGVYDNLGLSVLEPRRSPQHTAHVYEVDYIIACDAGRGTLAPTYSRAFVPRLKRSADITHRRAQDAARGRLHEAADAGLLSGYVHAYLGMRDDRLPGPVPNFVRLSEVSGYKTNFAAMPARDLDTIALRGEQLTRALLAHHCPEL